MSTSATIIVEIDGRYHSVYLHSDGSHLAWKCLNEHYTDRAKVEALVDLGDLSYLQPSIECPEGHSFAHPVRGYTIAYMRDRGETDPSLRALITPDLEDHIGAQYCYLFNEDDKWVKV